MPSNPFSHIAVVGDTHGHLQLALCVMARWQKALNIQFEALFLCGDVGTFTSSEQLDNATRSHAKNNPIELEFMHQWAVAPQPPWIDQIFDCDGLGLECPVVMVHGNHEGFAHLEKRVPEFNPEQVRIEDLPTIDPGDHIRYLPSGWRVALPSGFVVAGIGGIEVGQRRAKYHPMAYINDEAMLHLSEHVQSVDILITHQGPAAIQDDRGSPTLDMLLGKELARVWFHGHGIRRPEVIQCGPTKRTCLVPLGDAAFQGMAIDEPGADAWAILKISREEVEVIKETPPFLREFRFKHWSATRDGLWVCPELKRFAAR